MYNFWYNYVKIKYGEKFSYMDTDSFIVYIKADYIYKVIAGDVKARFDTSNYEVYRPLPKGKNIKVIWFMKDGLELKIMKNLSDYGNKDDRWQQWRKKAKGTQKCVIKRKFKFEDYKNCLEAMKLT